LWDVDEQPRRYNIDELADLAGVSRRTVRFYVQEGLLQAPLGVGRGRHYDRTHLDRLIEVRSMQESGRSLHDIKSERKASPAAGQPVSARAWTLPRSSWRRLDIAPGVELHLSSDIRLPPAHRLDELVEWCQRHLARQTEEKE
jgi:DNA-binding transcriptional MerR regulator